MFRLSVAATLFGLTGLSCEGLPSASPTREQQHWTETVTADLERGRCRDAIGTLQALTDDAQRDDLWYSLYITACQQCFVQTRDSSYLDQALSLLEAALTQTPESTSLLINKAVVLISAGRIIDALVEYRQAKDLTERKLKANPGGPTSAVERRLLGRLEKDIAAAEEILRRQRAGN